MAPLYEAKEMRDERRVLLSEKSLQRTKAQEEGRGWSLEIGRSGLGLD